MTNYDFRDQMTKKARGGCKFRIMVLNPEYARIGEKAHEEGDTAEMWIADIQTTTMKVRQLREQHQLNIELRYYDHFPILRGMFVNDHKLYFGWYGIGRQGVRSTLLVLENKPGSFYLPLKRLFEELWENAIDPLRVAPAE
jgi:hypothetical protein